MPCPALILACAAMAPAAAPARAEAGFWAPARAKIGFAAPARAEIAFVSGGRIHSARSDGSGRRLLVAPGRGEELAEPAWSPDGSRLAYVSGTGSRSRLMLLDAAGSRALTARRRGVLDASPAWSPDGAALAFARYGGRGRGIRSQIVVRDLAGAERVLVTAPIDIRLTSVGDPSWTPDGTAVAYTRSRLDRRHDFRPQVRLVPAAGGDSQLLLRDAQSAVWSPDGSRLAFASVRDRNGRRCGSDECWFAGELYTAAADGSGLTRLTANEGDDAAPAWAPDGSRILFSSDRNLPEADAHEVYSVAADGSCLTWLTNGTPASWGAAWRPGTGDRYDPGTCDPAARPALVDPPAPRGVRGGLWLGTTYRGMLLSRAERRYLAYDDCERFEPRRCRERVTISSEPACRMLSFRGLTGNPYRFLRRHGAIAAFYDRSAGVRLLSGHAVTTIHRHEGNRLRAVSRVIRALRPVGGSGPVRRLPPPRIPRRLARRLEAAAIAHRRFGTVERAARELGIPDYDLRNRLRLRAALRASGRYRFSTCRTG